MRGFSHRIMVDDDHVVVVDDHVVVVDDHVVDVDDDNSPSPLTNRVSEQVHVLAVDDSIVDRKLIEKLLKISSCKVTAVDSGRRALQFLGFEEGETSPGCLVDLNIDLIITDYCMPEMTGHELLKKIKGSSMFRKIPVVIMSSENACARIDRCLEDGAEEFIVKPVKLSDVERLKKFMAKKEQRRRKRKISEISSVKSPPSSPSHSSHRSSTPSPESQALIRLKMA